MRIHKTSLILENFCEEILWKALYKFSFVGSLVHAFSSFVSSSELFSSRCAPPSLKLMIFRNLCLALFRGFLLESKTEDFLNKKFLLTFVALLLLFAINQNNLLFIANKFKIESFSSSEISTRSPLSSYTTGDLFLTHSTIISLTASDNKCLYYFIHEVFLS